MPDAIETRGVSVRRDRRDVLQAIDFHAKHGEVSVIVGPNGAGKSTLLKAIAGLVPYTGTITIEGHDAAPLSPKERARLIAFVPQQTQLRAPMPVRDVVAQGRYARAEGSTGALQDADLQAIDAAMATAEVSDLATRPFTELSGGEQRRVLIARALCTGANVLLFDEPTASLDVRHVLALHRLVRAQATRGVAVVMVLHQLGDALRFADHALMIDQGRVVATGRPSDVITHETVSEVYGVQLLPHAGPSFEMKESI